MKLLILDGNSVINRAFFGVRMLTTRSGLYTNAVFGFLNILERIEKEEKPDAVCVAFDLHGPTFRHEKYELYKANRHGMPDELAQQMPIMKQVLQAMNIPIYECQGWEADDVIGTISRICSNNQWECVIVTGDRDSLQLIDDNVHVKLVISKPGQTTANLYDVHRFREEYGFDPIRMIDLKGLMGDSSDNIPGVAGVGPKTASELLMKFGSLQGVYDNLDDASIRPKLREKLEQGRDSAFLSYDLATIRLDAPIDFEPSDAAVQPYNRPALYELFVKLEFVKLIDRYGLRGAEKEVPQVQAKEYQDLPQVCEICCDQKEVALYICGDGSVAIASEEGACVFTPMEAFTLPSILGGASSVVCYDAKTTMHQLDQLGISCDKLSFDVALAAYILNPSQSGYELAKLSTNYMGITLDELDALSSVKALWNLKPILMDKLQQEGLAELYSSIDFPLCNVLYEMEKAGIAIDVDQLQLFGKMLTQRIAECEKLIFGYAGEVFNINSTKQLGQLLFEKLGIPPIKKTKIGYSTNADVLQKLYHQHPIIPAILEYRTLTKLNSTYADGLLKGIGEDGRIHTTFQNLVTATGRLSSTDPNLQNIPVRTDLGAQIRKMFVPKPGYVLVDADYSQIELRVLAHIAEDSVMQDAFRSGLDIHTVTASQVFHVSPECVEPLQRRHAKAVNFGIVYGISEFSLAEDIGVSRFEAKAYIDSYLNHYAGVKAYMSRVVEQAREKGYTQTIYGRRRYIPELASANYAIRQGAERIALNTPIQGTAADLIKLAMIRVHDALTAHYPDAKLLLQVHDELIVECPEDIAPQVAALVSEQMQQIAQLSVPLVAESKWGKSWFDAK